MSLDDFDLDDLFDLPVKKEAPRAADLFEVVAETTVEPEEISVEIVVDDDPDVIAAQERLIKATEQYNNAQSALESPEIVDLDKQRNELAAKIAELQREFYAIEGKRDQIRRQQADKRRAKEVAEYDLRQAERNIAVVKQSAFTRKKMQITIEGYQRIAQKFPWFTGIEVGDKTLKCLPHQWEGIKFLAASGRSILGDEMGLGKTLTAIAALDLVGSKRALVICPAEVTSNFLREVKRWAPHRKVVNINGMTKIERNAVLSMVTAFEPVVVICNYEAWRKDLSLIQRLIDIQFDTMIADEAHAVKGTNTDAFSGVRDISLADNTCPYCGALMVQEAKYLNARACVEHDYVAGSSIRHEGISDSERAMLSRSIKNLWMMTGTPILNAPEDLYPMLFLIDPLAFPYKNAYLREYCEFDPNRNKYVFKYGGLESLTKRLSGRYLARNLSSAGVILPPQDIIFHNIEFDETCYLEQQEIIEQLTEHAQIVLAEDNKMTAIGVLALITRQRQANVWPGGIKVWEYPKDEFGLPDKSQEKVLIFDASEIRESIKVDKVIELVQEHRDTGNRIAVFSQFKTGLAELERRLLALGISVVRFDGDTSGSLKERIKRNFDKSLGETPEWDVVLCNYKTGGVGLNLTAATHTIVMDEEWNPGKRDQAYARTHRMGQDEQTFVHVIRVKHTVDTWLADLIADKEYLIGGFNDSTISIQQEMLKAIKDGEW